MLAWTLVRSGQGAPPLSVWDLQDPDRVAAWCWATAWRLSVRCGLYFAVGLILPPVLRAFIIGWDDCLPHVPHGTATSRGPRWSAARSIAKFLACQFCAVLFITAALSGYAIAVVAQGSTRTSWALAVDMAVAGVATAAGVWFGHYWRRGGWGRRRLVAQALLACSLALVAATTLPGLIVHPEPLDLPLPAVTSADKRELVEWVQHAHHLGQGYRIYRIDADGLNRLVEWSLTIPPLAGGRAEIALTDDGQSLRGSLPVPSGAERLYSAGYLNVEIAGQCEIVGEELLLDLRSLQVGSVSVPGPAVRWLGRALAQWINRDAANAELLAGVRSVRADRDGVDVVVSDDGLRRRRVAALVRRVGDQADVAPIVRTHLQAFAAIADGAQRRDPLFDVVVRQAFQLAQQRSLTADPVTENRTAILALGIALGHSGIEAFVGDALDYETRAAMPVLLRQSRLRERADWSRHFWVSAALTVLAGDRISDAVGLLKEELDAGPGGSGFSFGDLMADRAGTEFARAATRDRAAASTIQQWVLDPNTDLQSLMPEAADLPERLNDEELDARFDGVGGTRYRSLLENMEQRLHTLPWRR